MSDTTTTPTSTPAEVHLTSELIGRLARAHGDSDTALTDRVSALAAALAYGVDVKTIAADMAAANRADDAIPAVSAATLGFSRFAITTAELIGTDVRAWIKRDRAAVALTVRAGKRVGSKAATTALRDALRGIDTAATTAREEIAVETLTGLRATVKAEKAPAAPRSAAGEPNGSTDDAPAAAPRETVGEDMSARAALSAVRAVTAWLTNGNGSFSADLASAHAELTAALATARRRGHEENARRAGTLTETVAA